MLRNYMIAWTLAFILFALVRGLGTEEQGSLQLDLMSSIKIVLTLGPLTGIYSGLTQIWIEENVYKRVPIAQYFLLRLLQIGVFLTVILIAAFFIYRVFFSIHTSLFDFAFQKGSLAFYVHVLTFDFLMNVFRQINLMLGSGNLSKLLTGKFYHPREENRIFMFLDLQSSTQHAERLGHELYSSLIQDCFFDLGVVGKDQATIYQYVGDEAVLTWDYATGLDNNNYLNAFFRFKKSILDKGEYYKSTYGIVPFFKAGVHAGRVMVTEIGRYKREIAYHGDTINTAARIQGKCNVVEADLLISQDLAKMINAEKYLTKEVGALKLRGKQEEVGIHKVSLQDDNPF